MKLTRIIDCSAKNARGIEGVFLKFGNTGEGGSGGLIAERLSLNAL